MRGTHREIFSYLSSVSEIFFFAFFFAFLGAGADAASAAEEMDNEEMEWPEFIEMARGFGISEARAKFVGDWDDFNEGELSE